MTAIRTFKKFLQYVETKASFSPSTKLKNEVIELSAAFRNIEVKPGSLVFFCFHVEIPKQHQVIAYRDVEHDHGVFDYQSLLNQLIWSAKNFNPESQVLFVTDMSSSVRFDDPSVTVIRLKVNPAEPVYERVRAMTAYVHSEAFTRNTVFLDTDAFPNRALGTIFSKKSDLTVTYRSRIGFMPINEGVIFASARRRKKVRAFFDAYLGTYEVLTTDTVVLKYYGNIKRWRGGQLALSVVGTSRFAAALEAKTGARITRAPCSTHNYTVRRPAARRGRVLDEKYVLHLKGSKKKFLGSVISYQRERLTRSLD